MCELSSRVHHKRARSGALLGLFLRVLQPAGWHDLLHGVYRYWFGLPERFTRCCGELLHFSRALQAWSATASPDLCVSRWLLWLRWPGRRACVWPESTEQQQQPALRRMCTWVLDVVTFVVVARLVFICKCRGGDCVSCPKPNVGLIVLFVLASWVYVLITHRLSQAADAGGAVKIFLFWLSSARFLLGPEYYWLGWLGLFDFGMCVLFPLCVCAHFCCSTLNRAAIVERSLLRDSSQQLSDIRVHRSHACNSLLSALCVIVGRR